jgi:glycosyltransferase involved in cell wall biosynthesis
MADIRKIRLAFLANGESDHTKRWLTYFVGKGYDVHLITFTAKPIKGVKIHELKYSGKLSYLQRIWNIRKAVKKIDPDVLHAHYISHYGVYGALTGFHPFVLTAYGSDIFEAPEKSKISRLIVKYAIKKANLVHTVSARARLIELGCDPRKIFVQQWGVDTNLFSPNARSQSLRTSVGVDSGYLVLCARNWEPMNNVEVFIKAAPLVLERMKNVKLVMLGGGSLEFKLKELARRLGVYEDIVFVGRVPEEEMPKYLASADVYVDTFCDLRVGQSGRIMVVHGTSGVGQTTRQAMACGTPQILSERPGTKSLDWFCGVLYKRLDHVDLAETIVQLLKNKNSREIIGRNSRKNALEIFDQEKIINQWENIYHRLKGFG